MAEPILVPQVIERPEDEALLAKLRQKLADYEARIGESSHPAQQLLLCPDGFLKHRILKTVLVEGKVEYMPLVEGLQREFPDEWPEQYSYFPNAWEVILDYCVHGGKHAINSETGQPGLA